MDIAGVIVTTTMLVTELSAEGLQLHGPDEFEKSLITGLTNEQTVEKTEINAGRVLRIVEQIDFPEPADQRPADEFRETDEMPKLPELKATYWLTLDDQTTLLNIVCTSPFIMLREGLLQLFDSIIGTLHIAQLSQL